MAARKQNKGAHAGGTRPETPVLFRLIKISKRIAPYFGERFAPLGIHPGQDRLLEELWDEDGLTQSELIARLGVEPPTVTGTLQRLEREGFVRREPDAENRRVSRVYLTDAGREIEGPVRKIWSEAEAAFLADLTSEERRALEGLLSRVTPPRKV